MRARPSIRRPRHCAGSRLARKYKDGLEAHIGDGVATRMKSENTLQQLDSTEDTQKPSSEIGFENQVWALLGPPNLSVGLRVCLYFITFDYSIIFLLLFALHAFHFYFYPICTLVLLVLLTLNNKMKNIYKHTFQIKGEGIRDYKFYN